MSNIIGIKKLYDMFSGLNIDKITILNEDDKVEIVFGNEQNNIKKYNCPIIEDRDHFSSLSINNTQTNQNSTDIVSPTVGIFERSNYKTEEYYVKLRDYVKKGQIVGRVKVLGIDYDVYALVSGKIIEILVEDEHPVEYGQPIMRLETKNEN